MTRHMRRWRRTPGPVTALVYVTSPARMIEGVVLLGAVTRGHPDFLWDHLGGRAALTEAQFRAYAGAATEIEIDYSERFEAPIDPRLFLARPPMRPHIYADEEDRLAQAGLGITEARRA